mgnify:CR=1 FL=1
MKAPVVIFAVGNPSRGDDAIGPEIHGQLEKWLENEKLADRFELIEDFQLQIEHALDLQDRQLALFIDAGQRTKAPFDFCPTPAVDRIGHSTHALEPGSVLQVFRDTENTDPPPAFTLCVSGQSFELGEPLTAEARENEQQAFDFVCELLANPDAAYWASRVDAFRA